MASTVEVSIENLNKLLERSIFRKHCSTLVKRVSKNLMAKEEPNVVIDALEVLTGNKDGIPGLRNELLAKYGYKLPGAVEVIPKTIQIFQAALMDSLMFGLNYETGNISLYTLNERIIEYLGVDSEKMLSKAYNLNKQGILHAYRIDVSYESPDNVIYKAVSLNKNTNIYADNIALFPYETIEGVLVLIDSLLGRGCVLKTVQVIEGLRKERFITTYQPVLKKFCDSLDAIDGLNVIKYPLEGYLYAPVIGAPSTTAMVTKISVFNLDYLSTVKKMSDITVEKAVNPTETLVKNRLIIRRLGELESIDPVSFSKVMETLPRRDELFVDELSREIPTVVALSKYLNSIV